MKVLFLGCNSFNSKSGKELYRVDVALKQSGDNKFGYSSLTGFTSEKHFTELAKIKPLTECDLAVFFPDDKHACNRIYLKGGKEN